ncbi:uncharacterized protein HMPREF1541_05051 [Cyphellophora europaea CBS 101466]|uniref:Uncharacterized protein n=1 Tax=Cyphellophora europaea (strain CBS 101466) TaxID=1220924 RepID=W2RW76_CYPE1|nr:uncharacterized protein HMPREF1541_05051 [Cyphellophora europaea CBS 101466]ETN40771.1 hypothetical protein HMPREF1541_05051 [Cyphellophora europaea CBS 101466]
MARNTVVNRTLEETAQLDKEDFQTYGTRRLRQRRQRHHNPRAFEHPVQHHSLCGRMTVP